MALRHPGLALPLTAASAPHAPRKATRRSMASPLIAAGRRRATAWSRVPFDARSSAARAAAAFATGSHGSSDRATRTTTRAAADVTTAASTDAGTRPGGYPFADIEAKWQKHWAENKTFATPSQVDTSKPKFYALDMFPYPSGAGLHVGHPEGYTATDIIARYKRMTGHNVLHPMGWDAFGLPAEQYAIETGTHPKDTTAKNIARFREQLQSLGFSYDWDREVATCDPAYFKWTQWIFLQLLEKDLAYRAEVPVNWCPALGTVLANEEVIDGLSERGNHPVVRKPMKQWMLKITEYGDRLLNDLDDLDWPESIKEMQRNWIGRSEGAQLAFQVPGVTDSESAACALEVYTTRPDTLFGVTYVVVAPEHPLVSALTTSERRSEVEEYVSRATRKSDLERTELAKEKTGAFTGSFAKHPLTGEDIPVWVADYVLGTYGTGAIMAVPAHDDRDKAFAETFSLPALRVVEPFASPASPGGDGEKKGSGAYSGNGKMVNSACDSLDVNGMDNEEAGVRITEWLASRKIGAAKVNFKLRDWLFARQRYWGEPFPVVYPEGSDVPVAVPFSELPLRLPETDTFKPSGSGEGPLANCEDWVATVDPIGGGAARRETNTMPQWAGSCWYYLRFIDPGNENAMVDGSLEKYWMPVDLYVGGAEHAVLHLLYARFWHKVLYDIGAVSTKEPFRRLVSQGMILGEVEYAGANGEKIAPSDVAKKGDGYVLAADETVRVYARAHKMSKSRGNVVNPDDVVSEYGADSLRLYEMFMGPLRETKVWQTKGVEGCSRFLARAYRLFDSEKVTDEELSDEQSKAINRCIQKVTEETEGMRFNTAIAAMMEFTNAATKWEKKPRKALEPFVLLLGPYAPHLSEELWAALGHEGSNAYVSWPEADASLLVEESATLAVQINGKMRGKIEINKDASQDEAMALAMAQESIAKFVEDESLIKKIVYVPGKILNVVAPPAKK